MDLRILPRTASVRSDPVLLGRIVQNLLLNALRHAHASKVIVGCRRQGEDLCIEVWDNGIGIPEAQRKAIFEEFYQLDNPARDRRKGFGLGLAIVERTARLLDHTIDVDSTASRGSRFAVTIPRVYVQGVVAGAVRPNHDDHDLSAALILVIDDEATILMSLRLLLEVSGFKVITAATGMDALRELKNGAVRPDLVISDYRLPAGETGIQVIQAIRVMLGSALPSILLTGDTSPQQVREAQESGCEVLYKPASGDELLMLIQRLLRNARKPKDIQYHLS